MDNAFYAAYYYPCYYFIMRIKKIIYLISILAISLVALYIFQDKKIGKGNNITIKYELVKDWLKLSYNFTLGNPTGIGIDTNQNICIFHRANRKWSLLSSMPDTYIKEKTILLIDKESGKILNSWGGNLFIMPHGLTVDKNNNIWVTDVGLHQVFKFNHDGKLLLKLGEAKISGNDKTHFNRPTDVAIANDGSFYVSDGYGNSRIVKFSSNGEYLFEWGKKGNKKSEFNIPHSIDLDVYGNVYVADRENNRIQIFDSTGKFLKEFSSDNFGNICAVTFDKTDKKIFAIDDLSFLKIKHRGSDVFIFDTTGNVQTRFGRSGSYDGETCWYHDIAVDNEQNIYVGDILGNKIQKFKKIVPR
jgi:peptidylamidoglycolate lyase